jgi:acyl homoserine lactone synthase
MNESPNETSPRLFWQIQRGLDNGKLAESVQRFRKSLFVDRLGWNLSVQKCREVDEFDTPDAVYGALFQEGEMLGCFRACRTDQPYLAATVFPELAGQRAYPKSPDVWEISRFGVAAHSHHYAHSRLLYSLMFAFAYAQQTTSLVAIADLNHERLLRLLGIRTQRFGEPKVVGRDVHGKLIEAVAGEIVISEQSGSRFSQILRAAQEMENNDASLVFGRDRVSA